MSGESQQPEKPRDLLYVRPSTTAVLKRTIHQECHTINNELAVIIGEASSEHPDVKAILQRGSAAAEAVRRLAEAAAILAIT